MTSRPDELREERFKLREQVLEVMKQSIVYAIDGYDASSKLLALIDQQVAATTAAHKKTLEELSIENKAIGTLADAEPGGYHCGRCDSWGVCHACAMDVYIGAAIARLEPKSAPQAEGE